MRTPTAILSQPLHVLREYALVADGYRAALIGPRGEVAWMCFPSWESPALFAGLVGSAGEWVVQPSEPFVWGGYYEDGSLVWRSRWTTNDGVIECREALARPASAQRAVLLRRLESLEGRHRIETALRPRLEYGTRRAGTWRRDGDGWSTGTGDVGLRVLGTDVWSVADRGAALAGSFVVEPGETVDLALEVCASPRGAGELDLGVAWAETESTWRSGGPNCSGLVGERDVRHAWAVLTGLSRPEGGTVAAATASLPERADRGRSYDYRYVWIRDLAYIGEAAAAIEATDLVEGATRFITQRLLEHGAKLAPAYTVNGDPVPEERQLKLPGYPGGTDIVGNHVRDQFQLDAFGEALIFLATADRTGALDSAGWGAVEQAASAIEARWREPDAGIWELDPEAWTHSRLIASAGLRAAADRPLAGAKAVEWLALADAILADASRTSLHSSGRWQRSPSDARCDASLLLPALRGAVSSADPRSVATLRAVCEELTEDGYVYRFAADDQALGEAEGAFLVCGFWISQSLLAQGDVASAARWFERTRAACGPPGLYCEEFDVSQRQLRGNLPQAFVHAELIRTSALLSAALDKEHTHE